MFFGKKLPCGKLTDDGKPRSPRRFQKLFVCNHMRNLPYGKLTNDETDCRVDFKCFLFVIICGICRFPQAGIPRQDSLTRK